MTKDRYKEKNCPQCGVIHRKRNQYCSQACANKSRIVTNETKQKLSERRREYLQTPEGIATLKRTGELNANPDASSVSLDEYAVNIPTLYDIPEGYTPGNLD